jgi:hypothetical protein
MIKRARYTCVLLVFIGLAMLACTQQRSPCLTPKIASLIIEAAHYPTDTATTTIDTALPHAVFVAMPPGDTLRATIYNQQSQYTISLSPDSTSCRWEFTTDSFKHSYDTLTFFYRRSLQFISNACGYTYFYSLDSVHTTHLIADSVQILNSSVTNNVNTKHLKIFVHPDF